MTEINVNIKYHKKELDKIKSLSDELDTTTGETIKSFLDKHESEIIDLYLIQNNKNDVNNNIKLTSTLKILYPLIAIINFLWGFLEKESVMLKILHYFIGLLDAIVTIIFINQNQKFKDINKDYEKYEDRIRNNIIKLISKTKSKELKNQLIDILNKINKPQSESIDIII